MNSVCIDREGRLWLNTTLGRILRSDETMHKFENVSLDNEIDDCTVLGLLSDKNSVWIITNRKYFNIILIRRLFSTILLLMIILW